MGRITSRTASRRPFPGPRSPATRRPPSGAPRRTAMASIPSESPSGEVLRRPDRARARHDGRRCCGRGSPPDGPGRPRRVQAVINFADRRTWRLSRLGDDPTRSPRCTAGSLRLRRPPPERADPRSAWPAVHHDARDPPFLLMHGTRDELVPPASGGDALGAPALAPSAARPRRGAGARLRGAEIDWRVPPPHPPPHPPPPPPTPPPPPPHPPPKTTTQTS